MEEVEARTRRYLKGDLDLMYGNGFIVIVINSLR